MSPWTSTPIYSSSCKDNSTGTARVYITMYKHNCHQKQQKCILTLSSRSKVKCWSLSCNIRAARGSSHSDKVWLTSIKPLLIYEQLHNSMYQKMKKKMHSCLLSRSKDRCRSKPLDGAAGLALSIKRKVSFGPLKSLKC